MSLKLGAIPLHQLPIAVLDFETTGLNASSDRIVQVGVIHFQGTAPLKVAVNSLINPQRPINPRASAIHGITDQDVARAPTFGDTTGRVVSSLEGRVLAAYNAAFDLRFLRAEMRRGGLDFQAPFICVMELRQMIFAGRRGRLVDACLEMGIRPEKAHDASADAHATALLLQRYFHLLQQRNVHTIDRLSEYGKRAFLSSFRCPGFSTNTSPVIESARQASDERHEQAERDCERLNQQALETVRRLETLLVDGIRKDVRVRWGSLMTSLEFAEPVPAIPAPEAPEKPNLALKPDPSQKPSPGNPKYSADDGVLYSLIPWLKEKKLRELEEQYQTDLESYKKRVANWNRIVTAYRERVDQAKVSHTKHMLQYRESEQQYQVRREAFLERAAAHNAKIGHERSAYEQGEPGGVARAMTRVLMNSELPPDFPDVVDINFEPANGLLRAIRQLPGLEDMPSIKNYRFIKKDGELKESPMSDAAKKRLYDGVVYQLTLRTVHELIKGDTAKRLRSIDLRCVINGYDPATGHPGRLVLARLCVDRERATSLRLENVDPEVCFKDLGGTTNGRPSNLKPMEVLPELKG